MSHVEPKRIEGLEELDAVLDSPLAVIYKHSPYCGTSAFAERQVRAFLAAHPAVPVYLVDVVRDRPLSREVERRLGIRHESPQVIVLRDGAPRWNASHGRVTAGALERELAG